MLFLKSSVLLLFLQILLLPNIAESTVVFTANLDDIKRLVQKVIPKNLSERIFKFLGDVKQTNKERADISQENEKNAVEIQEISDDDTKIFKHEAKHKSADRIKKSLLREGDETNNAGTSGIFQTPAPPEVRFSRKHRMRKGNSKKYKTKRVTSKTTTESSWLELLDDKKGSREGNIGQSLFDVFKKRIFRKDMISNDDKEAEVRAKPEDECLNNNNSNPDCNEDKTDTINEELNNDLDERERQKQSSVGNSKDLERDSKPLVRDAGYRVIATSGPLSLPQRKQQEEWWEKEFTNKPQSTNT